MYAYVYVYAVRVRLYRTCVCVHVRVRDHVHEREYEASDPCWFLKIVLRVVLPEKSDTRSDTSAT